MRANDKHATERVWSERGSGRLAPGTVSARAHGATLVSFNDDELRNDDPLLLSSRGSVSAESSMQIRGLGTRNRFERQINHH